jgi:histidine triad (HIT) family protein
MTECLFCRIARGEIPSQKVAESESAIAFRDISPQAPVHILIIPRKHFGSLNDAVDSNVLAQMHDLVREIVLAEGIEEHGYRCVINTGRDGGQTVGHLHLHLLAGRRMTWPPG